MESFPRGPPFKKFPSYHGDMVPSVTGSKIVRSQFNLGSEKVFRKPDLIETM